MKLTTVKTANETGIPGLEFVYTDKNITEVILGKFRIRKGESYHNSLQVLIETPFETAERYRLTGTIEGFPDAVSYHDDSYSAGTASAALEDKGAKVAVEKVSVLIDDGGNIIEATGGAPVSQDNGSDLPF